MGENLAFYRTVGFRGQMSENCCSGPFRFSVSFRRDVGREGGLGAFIPLEHSGHDR